MARSAGTSAQILGIEDKYVILRLTSGEMRHVIGECRATVGSVGNADYSLVNYGKAGRNRWRGIRPTVRGSVMNLTITLMVVVKDVRQLDVSHQ